MDEQKIFVIPSKECLQTFAKWFPVVLGAFVVIYYSCNSYAATQNDQYRMYTDWELHIPLVPQMIIVYMSYVLIFAMVLFVFKTVDAIRGLAYSMLITLCVSGVVFVVFPGHLGYSRQEPVPGYQFLFNFLYAIDKPHNLYPSLHITFASLCVLTMIQQSANRYFHLFLKIWFMLVCASVVLVHQHHLFDILLGTALGWVVYAFVYLRVVEKSLVKEEEPVAESAY